MRVLRSRVGVAGMMVFVLAIGSAALWTKAIHWRPNPATYPIQGLHVSAAQGEIAWNIVAARDADFVYVRATDGAVRDPRFAAHWRGDRKSVVSGKSVSVSVDLGGGRNLKKNKTKVQKHSTNVN